MQNSIKVAAIQMNSGDNVNDNLRLAGSLLAEAAAEGCVLALLPENFALMGLREQDKIAVAEDEGDGPIQKFLADAARCHGVWVIAGSLPIKSANPELCFGASVVFDDTGASRACYRKIHLFDVALPGRDESYCESATMDGGEELLVIDSPAGRLGLSICYDLRFPEMYRLLSDDGATVFSVPAAFTEMTGSAHWHTLLRARAIENLAYVIAAAQHGRHSNGRTTFGHSMIIDPWGQVLAELAAGNGIAVADIDTSLPHTLRTRFPALQHRHFRAQDNKG
jgi:nitrilase